MSPIDSPSIGDITARKFHDKSKRFTSITQQLLPFD